MKRKTIITALILLIFSFVFTACVSVSGRYVGDEGKAAEYYASGNTHYQKGNYDRAIADCTEAIRLNPNNGAAYNNRGKAYNGKGDYDRAIADCAEAIRLDPNIANPYRHRAFAYMNKGSFAQARADVDRALQINPDYQDAQTLSAELRQKGH